MSRICILLATYNGEKYLKQQLDSLFDQTCEDFQILARDDGSTDATVDILRSHNVFLLEGGENVGAKRSFGFLLEYALQKTDAQYFMFCDQDDIWLSDKIEKTIKKMLEIESGDFKKSALVHTDLRVVDERLDEIASSFWRYEHIDPAKNTLNRLLMQNTITGCTTMINRSLASLALPIPKECIMHDWWIGLVASACGKISYLSEPTIKYRQHKGNDTGAKKFDYKNIIKKAFGLFFSKELYIKHLDKNILQAKQFLEVYGAILPEKDKSIFENFISISAKSFLVKRKTILKYKFLKNGNVRNIGLFLRI